VRAVALAFTLLAAALIAAEPPSTPRLKGEFGVWDAETNGTPKLLPTRVVPLELGMMYGWRIQLTNKVESVRVKQVLTLPGAPQNWGTSTGIRLSADRRTATIETKQKPVDGWIFDIIRIADGDPEGKHNLEIFVDGKSLTNFQFETKLDAPFPGE